MKALTIVIAISPFAALSGLFSLAGAMSVVMVAPEAYWMIAAIFIVPIRLGLGPWRLANC